VKAAAELLAGRQRAGSGAFGRGEAVTYPPAEPTRLALQPPSALKEAVNRWLTRLPTKPALLPRQRIISLREMISWITSALEREARVSFSHIRSICAGPQDTAVAFLAVLTLMRRQAVVATQTELFGPIELSREKPMILALNDPATPEVDRMHGNGRRPA
jgi:chromatin segregation and condensation protein Rec8/ScpA/Scc1 (kleisin family)